MNRIRKLLSLLVLLCLTAALAPNLTLGAGAASNLYTLSLNPDASEFTFARIPDRQVEAGTPVGALPVLSRNSYSFGGWYTGEIGSGTCYTSETIMPQHDVTLYAYWFTGNPGSTVTEPGEPSDAVSVTTQSGSVVTSVLTVTETGARLQIQRGGFDAAALTDEPITLNTPTASVTFSTTAADIISAAADTGDLTFTVNTLADQEQSPRVRAVTGGRPAYDFTLMAGDTQLSGFGSGNARISVPYMLMPGENPNAVVVYYVDDADGNPHIVEGAYQDDTETFDFQVSHFSQFALGYNFIAFTDVPEGAEYYDAVTFCAARGITNGTGNGRFTPEGKLKRGEFIVMCLRAFGIEPDANPSDNFADAGNTWYTGYLAAAKRLNISNGTGGNLYEPEKTLTTQDMLTLFYRALKELNRLPAPKSGNQPSDFSDSGLIASYAGEAYEVLIAADIITGRGGKLEPDGDALRLAMAQVLRALMVQS